ncbi:DUF6597 domain-containing transcriptional factor [Bacillus salitolerans]|uniref:DUF6597 domain-containing transcriptional factor n=1 Tax=Bacillus salitolerans TaxID=1437434 RepID=A0ABW4LRY6_9BACI
MKVELSIPNKLVRPWVECYWNVEFDNGEHVKNETILPNGKVEMIFALEGNYRVMNRKTHNMKYAWMSGIHHEPLEIQYKGKSNLIGIRFYPHGLFPFFRFPIHETVNQVENLESIWGVFQEEMYHSIHTAKDSSQIYAMLDSYLIRKISESKTKQLHVLTTIINRIRNEPTISIPDLASNLGFTQRHFNRLFKDHTGVNPKLLSQIYRFEKAFSYLFNYSNEEVADLILSLGYYDQSHFNKEFKRFSGMTPGEYKEKAVYSNNFL